MAISLVATHVGGFSGDSTPLGPLIPVLVGDIVIMSMAHAGFNSYVNAIVHGTSTATAVITEVSEDFSGTSDPPYNVNALYRVTGAGDLQCSPNMDTTRDARHTLTHWRGVDNAAPVFGARAMNSGTANTLTGAAISAGKAGDVFVSWCPAGGIGVQFRTLTRTSGWTLAGKHDNVNDASGNRPHTLLEYRVATDTSPLTSAPTISGAAAPYRNTTFVLSAAPEIVPGTIVARGLYL